MNITCPKCQYVRQPQDRAPEGECPRCGIIYAKFDSQLETRRRAQEPQEPGGRADTILASTTPDIPGRDIECVVDVISAECAYGMNLVKDWVAGLTDIVGGRSNVTQNALRDARRAVMADLRAEALGLGAHAVVGIQLDFSEFSGGGKSMFFVVATGTAVRLRPLVR